MQAIAYRGLTLNHFAKTFMCIFQFSSDNNHLKHYHYFIAEETGSERIKSHLKLCLAHESHALNNDAREFHIAGNLVRESFLKNEISRHQGKVKVPWEK